MAKNTTISIGFSIQNGSNGLNNLVLDAKDLSDAMNKTVTETEKLKKGIVNLAALGNSLKNFKDSWATMGSTLKELTSESNTFSSAMKATNTMAGLNAEGLDALKGQSLSYPRKLLPFPWDNMTEEEPDEPIKPLSQEEHDAQERRLRAALGW